VRLLKPWQRRLAAPKPGRGDCGRRQVLARDRQNATLQRAGLPAPTPGTWRRDCVRLPGRLSHRRRSDELARDYASPIRRLTCPSRVGVGEASKSRARCTGSTWAKSPSPNHSSSPTSQIARGGCCAPATVVRWRAVQLMKMGLMARGRRPRKCSRSSTPSLRGSNRDHRKPPYC